MALSSLIQLRSSVRDWAKRQSIGDSLIDDFVTLTESVFNYGERDDSGGYVVYPLRVRDMETVGTVTVTNGSGSLPADFLEPITVTNPSAVTNAIDYATGEWIANTYPTGQNTTDPHFYTIVGSNLYSTIDVTIPYYAKIPSLVADQQNWLLTKAPNAYLYGCLMQYSTWDKNAEQVAGYRSLMVNALGGLNYADVNSRAGSMTRRASMPAF
jgi:hypothetical protein